MIVVFYRNWVSWSYEEQVRKLTLTNIVCYIWIILIDFLKYCLDCVVSSHVGYFSTPVIPSYSNLFFLKRTCIKFHNSLFLEIRSHAINLQKEIKTPAVVIS